MSNSRRVKPHKPEAEPPERGHHVLDIHDGQLGTSSQISTSESDDEKEASDGEMGR